MTSNRSALVHATCLAGLAVALSACSGADDFSFDLGLDTSNLGDADATDDTTSPDDGRDDTSPADTGDAADAADTPDGSGADGPPPPRCGDGNLDDGEECDTAVVPSCAELGEGLSVPVCTAECTLDLRTCSAVEVCGDGLVEGTEACDDGNVDDGDGCSPTCVIETCDPEADADDDGINDCDDVEECDGLDNDGDGTVDDAPTDDEIGTPCYTGPEGTEGVGICVPGAVECRGGALVCVGDVTPQFDELCNDLDDDCDGAVPPEEIASGCSTTVVVTPDPFRARFEIRTPPRAVDVVLNVDTTGSMGGELANVRSGLRDIIVPGVVDVLPDAAFAVSTFDDFPIGGFGDPGDLPFLLRQRVTTVINDVQLALDAAELNGGNDTPESGIESLFQIVSGVGTRWPAVDDSGAGETPQPGFAATLERDAESEEGDVDDYVVALEVGDVLTAELFSSRLGLSDSFDTYLYVYDATSPVAEGEFFPELTRNDDSRGGDSFLTYTATSAGHHIVRVASCCGGAPGWGGDIGTYVAVIEVNGVLMTPEDAGPCDDADTNEDGRAAGPSSTAGMVVLSSEAAAPASSCEENCAALGADGVTGAWAGVICRDETQVCGNGAVEGDEACDDGNLDDGDGCAADCTLEFDVVPPFVWRTGFSAANGHGRIGGVGFREGAVPIVVHVTDAESHEAEDYTAEYPEIDAHSGEETVAALNALGARIVGIASSESPVGSVSTPLDDYRFLLPLVLATGSVVPLCAFDGTAARESGACTAEQCCTGVNGAGREASEDGTCPLVFRVDGGGTGLSDVVVRGIRAVANFGGEQLSARLVAPLDMPVAVECMISSLEVSDIERPGDCLPELRLDDLDGDGLNETLLNATPSTRATFSFTVANADLRDVDGDEDTTEPCIEPGAYALRFEIRDADGDVVFAQRVEVVVPDR